MVILLGKCIRQKVILKHSKGQQLPHGLIRDKETS